MNRPAYFIRRDGEVCSIIKVHTDETEEILEQGLTFAEAETLYFICIGEPVHKPVSVDDDDAGGSRSRRRRPRQLVFRF